ncbi:hypothetical protein [Bartonella sp. B39]
MISFFKCIFDVYVMMVKVLLPRAEFDSSDAADALALAPCLRAHRRNVNESYYAKVAM